RSTEFRCPTFFDWGRQPTTSSLQAMSSSSPATAQATTIDGLRQTMTPLENPSPFGDLLPAGGSVFVSGHGSGGWHGNDDPPRQQRSPATARQIRRRGMADLGEVHKQIDGRRAPRASDPRWQIRRRHQQAGIFVDNSNGSDQGMYGSKLASIIFFPGVHPTIDRCAPHHDCQRSMASNAPLVAIIFRQARAWPPVLH
ncbi:hypothetical protein ACLOJK_020287, partial [Asimina triloba]